MSDLSTSLGSLALKNPIFVAAGTFGYGVEFQEFFDIAQLGGVITKTLTLQPREGNPAPRVVETPAGMLNAVGLQNVGIDAFLKDKWPGLKALGVPVVISVAGFKEEEFVACAERLQSSGVAAIELNLSCPNVAHGTGAPPEGRASPQSGGRCFAQNAQETESVVRAVKKISRLPVFAKLSPEVADVAAIAKAAEAGGADVLTLINTMPGMAIDVETERPMLAHITGGLSGPAIRPIAVRCIWEVRKAVKTPILGIGGVASGRDALELILAGASAVAVGTASFANPRAPKIVLDELASLLAKKNKSARECVGATHLSSPADSSRGTRTGFPANDRGE